MEDFDQFTQQIFFADSAVLHFENVGCYEMNNSEFSSVLMMLCYSLNNILNQCC
jgi:hypothetical protein